MRELNISISDNELKSPHEDKCKLMYAQILDKLMGINVLTQQIPYNKLKMFEHPSLHESSIMSVRLFRELIKFMQNVGVTDFSISDLISPESPRTIRNLSAIINFARWREQKYQIYQSKSAELAEKNKKWLSIKAENERLAAEFVQLTHQKNQEKPQIEILQSEIDQITNDLGVATEQFDKLGVEGKNIKKEAKRLEAAYSEKVAILNKNSDIIHNLSRKIVKSPERIKKELRFLSNKIEQTKIEISDKSECLKVAMDKEKNYKILHDLVNKRIEEMKQIYSLKNGTYHKLEHDIKIYQNEKKALQKELNSIIKTHKSLNTGLATKKKEYSVLSAEHKAKKEAVAAKNKEINRLKDKHSQKRIAKQTQIANIDKQIEATKDSMSNLFKENKQNINELNIKYKQLLHAVSTYHNNMSQAMQHW